jgi:regulator of protease activity HflC (stomatin/prohibitin superfamily)
MVSNEVDVEKAQTWATNSPIVERKTKPWRTSIALGCAIILFSICSSRVVPAGHVGVVEYFGHVKDDHLTPGLHFVNPLSKVISLSTRTQALPYDRSVLSSEGLTIDIVLSLQFSVDPTTAVTLYKDVGENYKNVIVIPTMSSIIREVTSKRDAKAMYTSQTRMQMHKEMKDAVSKALAPKGIVVQDVLLRDVRLPDKLKDAIESKLDMEQQAERMKFVLQKEQQEAERKKTEAMGIQTFQKIVSEGINQDLLEWKGIEATERLSESTNTKIVFIGRSGDGLPLMFDPTSK